MLKMLNKLKYIFKFNNIIKPKISIAYIEKHMLLKTQEILKLIPKEFHESFIENSIIAGGSIWSLYHNLKVNDYDVFITDEKLAKQLREYFYLNSLPKKYKFMFLGKINNNKIILTDYGISIKDIQFITKFNGNKKDIVQEFDCLNNMFYYDLKLNKIINVADFKYLETNKYYFNEERGRDIANCVARSIKMSNKGFIVTKKEIYKMLRKLSEVGFNENELKHINHNLDY